MDTSQSDSRESHDAARIIDEGIETIETHLTSVSRLPLSDSYRAELTSTLKSIHSSLIAMKPILAHLGAVRSLIIAPVERGVDRAFSESNKWSIRGLIVSVVSLIISALMGIVSVIPGRNPSTVIPKTTTVSAPGRKSQSVTREPSDPCRTPVIQRLLRGTTDSGGSIFVYGDCLSGSRVSVAGIDLFISGEDSHLIEIRWLPPLLPGETPVVRVSKLVSVLKENRPVWARLFAQQDVLAGTEPIVPLEWPIFSSDVVNEDSQLARLGLVKGQAFVPEKDRKEYEAEVVVKIQPAVATILWSSEESVTLGSEPGYFGKASMPIGISRAFDVIVGGADPRLSRVDLLLRIETYGIGPQSTDSDLSPSLVIVNGEKYDLLEAAPFKGVGSAVHWKSDYIVRLNPTVLRGGKNRLEIVAGQYRLPDGKVSLDNFVITKLQLLAIR